jgi:hypothetical protein
MSEDLNKRHKAALDVALLDLDVAAIPSKSDVFVRCGPAARDLHDAITDLRARLQAAEERAEKAEAENAQLKLTVAWAKSFGAAHDMMQDALTAISRHADNQDIGHIDYRMHTKQQADFALEQCAGSPGLLDPAPTPKPDWTDGQWKWADEECAALKTEGA